MKYRIKIKPSAKRQLKRLPQKIRPSIGYLIDSLSVNPRPGGIKKLKGKRDFYRVKSGDYRVIYTIDDDVLLVTVIKVRIRGEAYLKLGRL